MRKKKDMLKRERYVKVHAAERMMRCLAQLESRGKWREAGFADKREDR